MPDIKEAQIIASSPQVPAIPEIQEEVNPLVVLANKLDSVFDANSDMRGILVDIRKDTREITRIIKQAPTEKRVAPSPTVIAQADRQSIKAAEKPTIKKETRTERVVLKKADKSREVKPPTKETAKAKTSESQKTVEKIEDAQSKRPAQKNKSKPVQMQQNKAEAKKALQASGQRPTPTKSQKSLETRKNEQEREKDRKSILSGIQDAVVRVGSVGIDAGKDALENKDLTDIAGTAIGGPLWSVLKEVKEVKDNTGFGRLKSAKDRLTGRKNESREKSPQGVKRDKAGRLRDNKGQYIKTGKSTGQDAKSRVIERKNSQNIEDQKRITAKLSELGAQTVDTLHDENMEEEKRHKELIDTVKEISTGGKLGMARTGMDMFRGARDKRRGKRAVRAKAGRNYQKRSRGPELVERKRPKQAFGKIKVPKYGRVRRSRGIRYRGKLGKIAGLLSGGLGFAGGGGLISGLFGGGDSSPVAQMVTDHVLSSVASKAATKLGGKAAMKMGGKLAGGALRAVPVIGQIASLGMAGIDAFQGWNDRDMQARAFGLKEGQEATTGQKVASSVANVFDMGGLGTGLLSMFGVDADTADIARGIHGIGSKIGSFFGFGGNDEQSAETSGKKGDESEKKGLIGQAKTEIKAPIATIREKVKSLWGWFGNDEGKPETAAIKTAAPIEKPNTVAVQKTVEPPVTKIEHPRSLPKVERIEKNTQVETTQGGPGQQVDTTSLNRLIAALARTTKNASYPFASPSQQPTVPKTNIKADFEDSMLTLMAYDRI